MAKIIQLPQNIISKISAGEVIERPAYAVKELIENSIDAKADIIEIHVEDAGLKRITILDNGEGMSRKDLEICFLPHTTSKLRDEHELVGIKTLGFRGEALSSIAAIATLTIQSRTQNDLSGTQVIIRNGNLESISPIGTPPGTIVTVDHLFFNVPARKKFLKSERTEFRLITDMVIRFALSYPSIHFVLTHNKKTILDLRAKDNAFERVKVLLGASLFDQLIPLRFEDGYIKIFGLLGKPQVASKQNQKQFIFVNNRHITDRMISLSVKEAFGTLLPASTTPIFLLHINLPPELVDVNVHPRKEQIAFINARQIFDALKQATVETLNSHNLTFKLAKFKQESSARLGETTSCSGVFLKETVLPWNRGEEMTAKPTNSLIQIRQTYIFFQTKDGMFFLDQHAAHERILFEQFVKAFKNKKLQGESYELSDPFFIDLSLTETQILDEFADWFEKLGFHFEHFQGNSFLIRKAPVVFKGRNLENILREVLSDLENETPRDIDTRSQRMLTFLACGAAVKSGDVLTQNFMQDIVNLLDKTPHNVTCPHGRPTRIQITWDDLNKLFYRS